MPLEKQPDQKEISMKVTIQDRLTRIGPFLLIVGTLAIAVFIGWLIFGKKDEDSAEDTEPAQEAELTFWGANVSEELMGQVISEFEEENSGITVTYEKRPKDEYETILKSRLETGNAEVTPDIFEIDSGYISNIRQDIAVSESVLPAEIESTHFPAAGKVCVYAGAVYCLPGNFDGLVLAYNQDWLGQAGVETIPDNWSDFKATADSLTQRQNVDVSGRDDIQVIKAGVAMGTGTNIRNSAEIAFLIMMQNGVLLNESSGWRDMGEENGVDAVELYALFAEDKIWQDSLGTDIESFLNGKTSMIFVTSEDLGEILESSPGFEVKTTMPPQVLGQKNIVSFKALSVAESSPSQSAAWKFVSFLSSAEAQRILLTSDTDAPNRRVPCRKDLLHEVSVYEKLSGFQEIFMTAEPVFLPDYSVGLDMMVEALDSISLENASVKSELSGVVSELRSVL